MGDFTPKVTIELSEYEYLKDVKYQALDLLKGKFKIRCFNKVNGIELFATVKGPGIKEYYREVYEIHLEDIKDYLNNLFGKEIMILQDIPSEGEDE